MRPPYGGNREAFARYRFRFRILASADQIELGHELFGQRFRMPVHLAPTAIQPSASGPRGCSSGDLFSMRLRSGVPNGVSQMLELLREEVELSMSLLGARRLSELSEDLLMRL